MSQSPREDGASIEERLGCAQTLQRDSENDASVVPSEPLLHNQASSSERDQSEGEIQKADGLRFTILLTLAAGLGGFLFGFDTGVISGALLYIRDEFPAIDKSTSLQEAIVSVAILGAAVGSAGCGRLNDARGRCFTILCADGLFALGSMLMAMANGALWLLAGRLLVGLGVGAASITVPLYVAEAAPPALRGALVTACVLMITGGQFISYVANVALAQVPGTWRWMLGAGAVPALLQAGLMTMLPESPRWLFKEGRRSEAAAVLVKLRGSAAAAEEELAGMAAAAAGPSEEGKPQLRELVATTAARRSLLAGVGMQVFQQLVGINTVMYYSPTIVELAGYASHNTALVLSMGVAAMNVVGTVIGMLLIDRCGRRPLALASLAGVVGALLLLALAFRLAAEEAPAALQPEPGGPWGPQAACPLALPPLSCSGCIAHGCGFCAALGDQAGTCLQRAVGPASVCASLGRAWYLRGCPSRHGALALLGLGGFILAFAPGMGPVPWAINTEVYPERLRGLGGSVAATANWVSNLVVAQTFLSLTRALGPSSTFLVFAGISCAAIAFVLLCVPETKGLSLDHNNKVWQEGGVDDEASRPSLNKEQTSGHGIHVYHMAH